VKLLWRDTFPFLKNFRVVLVFDPCFDFDSKLNDYEDEVNVLRSSCPD
jgi:hypothetical protein